MAARPSWPRISALGVGLALCAVAGATALRYASELSWSARELPGYLRGHIGSPLERRLYRAAREMLRDGRDPQTARAMLERAAAIDPTCEAVYLLGEWHLAAGHLEQALAQFSRYIDLDPTEVGSYLKSAQILERLGRPDEARAVLRRGLDRIQTERALHVPRPDPEVAPRYNVKAIREYEAYGESAERLAAELSRLGSP